MPPPKSAKLRDQLTQSAAPAAPEASTVKVFAPGEEIPVKKVTCYNDFVAILQFRIQSNIILEDSFKNEGMVVGVGPGIPGPGGMRVPSQLKLGDVVSFYGNPTTALEPKSGVFAGQKIIIIPERAVMVGLPPVPFREVTEVKQGEE